MAYIICEPCVGTCDTACVEVCPVDCIHGPHDKTGAGAEAKVDGFLPEENDSLYIDPEECINCGACEPECPNTAIYEGAEDWRYKDGTSLKGDIVLPNGKNVNAEEFQMPISDEFYFIASDKCTECKGFHEEPQCAAVCPVDCCIPDEKNVETEEELLGKQSFMHK